MLCFKWRQIEMSYPPHRGDYPMYGAPPLPGGGSHYPPPGGPLGFDNFASQPPMGGSGVSTDFDKVIITEPAWN